MISHNNGYVGLSDADFKQLHRHAPVNACLRGVFTKINQADEYKVLAHNTQESRQALMLMQKKIMDAAHSYPLNRLPLYLKKDTSSGASYLRWRNCSNNCQGQPAWEELIQDGNIPLEIREAMLQIEKDRICANMQMAVLNFILRQARECEDKLNQVENLFYSALDTERKSLSNLER